MKLLLDTHAFLWMINDDYAYLRGKNATQLFLDENNTLFLSLASVWEMAIKVKLGKLDLKQPLVDFIPEQLAINDIQLLDIQLPHVLKTMELPFHHRDPFDRLIIAQAQAEEMTLLSVDNIFIAYDIKLIW
jgi:PIN domain nuclease of toxin-antitoxin system